MQSLFISRPLAEIRSCSRGSTVRKWPKGDLKQTSLKGVTRSLEVMRRASRIVHLVSLAMEFWPSS